jgi:hypothetical protein
MNDYDKVGRYLIKSPYLEELRENIRITSLEEGEARGGLKMLRGTISRLGEKKFGTAPTKKQRATLEGIDDLARLERISDRLLTATSWADLLATE